MAILLFLKFMEFLFVIQLLPKLIQKTDSKRYSSSLVALVACEKDASAETCSAIGFFLSCLSLSCDIELFPVEILNQLIGNDAILIRLPDNIPR